MQDQQQQKMQDQQQKKRQQSEPIYSFVSYSLPPIGETQIYEQEPVDQNQSWLSWTLYKDYIKALKSWYLNGRQTLYDRYKDISLVIISMAISSKSAMKKSIQYQIPYVQIHVFTQKQQQILKQRIFRSVEISHFMNQSFLVYGQILINTSFRSNDQQFVPPNMILNEKRTWQQIQIRSGRKGKMLFRNASKVYAQILIQKLAQFQDQPILETLKIIRSAYYQQRRQRQRQKESPNQIISNRSNFMELNSGVIRMNIQGQQQHRGNQFQQQMDGQQQIDGFNQDDQQHQIDQKAPNSVELHNYDKRFNDSSDSENDPSQRSQKLIEDEEVI